MSILDFTNNVANRGGSVTGGWREAWSRQPKAVRWIPPLLLIVVLILLPKFDEWSKDATGEALPILGTPGTSFAGVLFLVGVYVLCATGLNVVVGLAGLLDLGYVGFFAVGAYTVAVFGSPNSDLATAYPWLICVPIGVALTMVAGVLLGGPTLRLRGDYLAIVTLGFGEIVRLIAVNTDALGNRQGISGIPRPPGEKADGAKLFGFVDVTPFYWLVLGAIIIVLILVGNLERSRVGRAWLAIREDEDAAELMGVPTFKFKLWAFAIGASVGGISGALFASRQGFINPDTFDVLTSILFLAAVVIGGAGNKFGVILGAIIVVYLPERLRGFDESLFATWFVVLGVVILIMLLKRRATLLGSSARTIATLAGLVIGLVLAVVIGTSLPQILESAEIEDKTPALVGALLIVLLGGAGIIALIRKFGASTLPSGEDGSLPDNPTAISIVGIGMFLAVFLGAVSPFVFREIGDGVQELRYFAFGFALIVMSVFRPQGLLPNRRRATELADREKEVAAGVNA